MVCPVESTARYKIAVLPIDPDVGFIDTVAFISAFQVRAAALIELRPVDLNPALNATGVVSRPRSSPISTMCANDIGNRRYHRLPISSWIHGVMIEQVLAVVGTISLLSQIM
jgi:hypothetical protein